MVHLARHSQLRQLPPVTSALGWHCPSIDVSSQQLRVAEERLAWTYTRFQRYHFHVLLQLIGAFIKGLIFLYIDSYWEKKNVHSSTC